MEHEDKKEENDEDVAANNEDDADSKQEQQEREADNARSASGSKPNSLFSSVGGYIVKTLFGSLITSVKSVRNYCIRRTDAAIPVAGVARRCRQYLEPPMDAETFAKWKTATQSDELETVKAEVLEHYPAVVEKFTELVPSAIDAEAFWMHYIYKASLLAAQEQRGADLLEHALNDSEEEIGWDVDSPRNDDSDRKKSGSVSFFPEEETKEADPEHPRPAPVVASTVEADALKSASTKSSSSDGGESWIELDERKDQQAPLSTSSSVPEGKPANIAATAAGVKTTAAATDDEEELDWGDDDLIPEEALSNDEASTAEAVPAFHEEPKKKRAGDWGEWD
ncbi:hypothetical protein FI667_g16536, partial [Globisporangium splendens]